ncbi:MAG: LamG domain-containing protein, partial [Saprospiraceae bacterium]
HLFGFSWSGPVFEVGETDGHLTFNGGTLLQSNTVLIRDGKWHHLAAVKNGNLATIFLDGVPVIGMINLNVGTYTGAAQNFHIGDWTSGGLFPRFWKGQIDEFKVWGAALGTLQVQEEMFCSLDPKNVNLLVHFPFDQYTAWGNNLGQTLAQNVVLSGPNGTLKNFALLGNTSNWVGRGRDRLPNCNVDHFAWYEGNNRGNYAGRSKVYDGDIFTAGQEIVDPILTPLDEGHPTFTRRRPDGSVAWRVLFNIQGVLNDFIRTDEGCYLLVGHTPKYLLNNRCFIARVSPTGALQWMHEFDFANDRESLNRIIRSDNPSAGLYPYIISGIMRNPMPGVAGSTYDDVLLLAVDNQGSIGWMRKLGDNAGSFTDDEFHADLINFNGGYALTGLYRNTIIAYPVIFQTDYAGVQRSISTQYQSGDYFSDIEPISNGSALIIAGQLSNGNALLAKVDASGNQIWSKAFPLLGAFRKLVIQPNGDIYAVGQRKLPLGRYHNVIVKVHDSGTTMSVIWQKSAEQAVLGEFEWKPADLAWYSGKMFFFTDTRYILRPGWYNGNIGAAMYALDQTPDICPFIKEALPVPVDYPLLRSQMAPLTGNPFTPPAPIIGIPAAALVLPRDSLCPDYGCDCSFIQLVFSKNWPIPVWSKSVADCGLAPVALPGCPSQYNPIKFSGKLQCKGGCAFNGITWTITDPNNIVTTGASASAFFNIPLPLSLLQIPAPGVYTIVLTGKCGTKTCTCTVKFTVPACPPPCDCTEPKFTNDVNAGFNWIQLPNCQFKFTAKSLTPCDVVAWKVAASGTNLFTTIAVGSGNQTINYQFPVTGQYVVCMTVKRTPAGGGLPCTKSRCWTLDVDCSLLADFANLQDNCSGS